MVGTYELITHMPPLQRAAAEEQCVLPNICSTQAHGRAHVLESSAAHGRLRGIYTAVYDTTMDMWDTSTHPERSWPGHARETAADGEKISGLVAYLSSALCDAGNAESSG